MALRITKLAPPAVPKGNATIGVISIPPLKPSGGVDTNKFSEILQRVSELIAIWDTPAVQFANILQGLGGQSVRITDLHGTDAVRELYEPDPSVRERDTYVTRLATTPNDLAHDFLAKQMLKTATTTQDLLGPLSTKDDDVQIMAPTVSALQQQMDLRGIPNMANVQSAEAEQIAPQSPRAAQRIFDSGGGAPVTASAGSTGVLPQKTMPAGQTFMLPHPGAGPIVVDPRENVTYFAKDGSANPVFGVRDGKKMAIQMAMQTGTTEAQERMWSRAFDGGRGITCPPDRETKTQRTARSGLLRAQVDLFVHSIIQSDIAAQSLEWHMVPEHLGLMFLKPEVLSAMRTAAWQTHYTAVAAEYRPSTQQQREQVPLIDLMTHEMTMVPFAHLTFMNMTRARLMRDQSRSEVKSLLEYTDSQINALIQTLSQVRRNMASGNLALQTHYDPLAYSRRLALQAQHSSGRSFSDIPPVVMMTPLQSALYTTTRRSFGNPVIGGPPLDAREYAEMQARAALVSSVTGSGFY